MIDYKLTESLPSPVVYNSLRKSAGWFEIDLDTAVLSLNNSIFIICAVSGEEIIGTARIIGDGGINYYIQDLIVFPEYQNQGIGTTLFTATMEYIKKNAPANSFIGLMAAKGKEGFYERFDFIKRPDKDFGAGMCLIIKKQ